MHTLNFKQTGACSWFVVMHKLFELFVQLILITDLMLTKHRRT